MSPITLYTDASDFGIGGFLSQTVNEVEHPIAFISKSLSEAEINWSTIEKECYAIVYSLKKLDYLLSNRMFTLKTDDLNLTFMDADTNPKVKRWKLSIQHYDCMIEYITGPTNVMADPMSRLVASNKVGGLANSVAALREVSAELLCLISTNLDVDLEDLGEGEEHGLYILKNNPLYPKSVREFQISPSIKALIDKVHNAVVGHHGVERTFDKLVAQGHHWPYMREHVKYYIRKCCPLCQKMSYLKTPIQTNPFTTAAYSFQERQNWDSIGPITLADGNQIHILVAICCFTRWVELWITDDVSGKAARLPMLQHWNRYGQPAQILTDNGPQFVNKDIKELCLLSDIQHITVMAYSKEENSIVERINKEVMRHLRAFIFEWNTTDLEQLREMVSGVQRICNANRTSPNMTSPAQLLFGNAINLDRGLLLPKTVINDRQISMSGWAASMLESQEKACRQAERLQREKDETHMSNANPNPTEYPIGSWVLAEYHSSIIRKGPPSKLNTQLRGPYKVLKRELDAYTIRNTVTRKDEEIHGTFLRPFLFDSNFIDPRDVAMKDAISTFVVEAIIEHEGDRKRLSTLFFKTRWLGYDESHDLWLPWKELRDNTQLHQYLRENGLASLIPKEHR